MNYVRSKILNLKYLRFTPSGSKDIMIGKFEFVAKNQFLFAYFFLTSSTTGLPTKDETVKTTSNSQI